jgi:hypothetical protein
MAAGRAGERFAERAVPMVMERGGLGAEMLQGMSRGTVSPMDVYHGSPHKFDRFDASKIGTGEGAQAYGHGLYLAEAPDVAQAYANKLTQVDGRAISDQLDSRVRYLNTLKQQAAAGDANAAKTVPVMEKSIADLKNQGSLYKVDLPDEQIAKMLDWDKPLNQQSAYVQAAMVDRLKSIPEDSFSDWTQAAYRDKAIDAFTNPESVDITGSGLYKFLQAQTSGLNPNSAIGSKGQDFASDYLRQAGIPGIRYLDGGSRSTGGGTSNFVVFPGNESMLTIMERNNQPVQQAMQEFEQGLANFMATK